MKKLILLFAIVSLVMVGCGAPYNPSPACQDGDSVILKVTGGNPTALDKTLLTANFVGLEKGKYEAAVILDFLDKVEAKVADGVSYADMVSWLVGSIEQTPRYAGVSAIILGTDIGQIAEVGGESLISECDRQLIMAHLKNQRGILAFY